MCPYHGGSGAETSIDERLWNREVVLKHGFYRKCFLNGCWPSWILERGDAG